MTPSLQEILKKKTFTIFVGLCLFLSLASGFGIAIYIDRVGKELVNAWLESEAISIQEGNFVVGLSRFSRAIFSSNVVTSIAVLQIRSDTYAAIASYGEPLDNIRICKIPAADKIEYCFESIFHEVLLYRSSFRPDLIAVFDLHPSTAVLLFVVVSTGLSSVSLLFLFAMRKILRDEQKRRFYLLSSAIDDLMKGAEPNPVILNELPEVAKNWRVLTSHMDKIKNDLAISTREAAVGRITAQLSHDLRAPLLSIERLLHLPIGVSVLSQQNIIRESLNRLNSMIESLRNTDLELMIEPQYCVLDFSIGFLGLSVKAQRHGISLFPPKVELKGHVRIDALKFERAWVNLVSNAIDAAKSEVRLEIETCGTEFRLTVIDDGPGIPDSILPNLFNRGMTQGKSGGTGLGLAYARQVMRGHGGDITYQRVGARTIFECQIPHAFILKEEKKVKNPVIVVGEFKSGKVKRVAICLLPSSLSLSVLANLISQKMDDFSFSSEFAFNTDIVVSNDDEILFKALDEEKIPIQIKKGLTELQITDRLFQKFKPN